MIESYINMTGANFMILTKLYVPVVTLSTNNNIKFLDNLNQGFKRAISCKRYKCEKQQNPKATI